MAPRTYPHSLRNAQLNGYLGLLIQRPPPPEILCQSRR